MLLHITHTADTHMHFYAALKCVNKAHNETRQREYATCNMRRCCFLWPSTSHIRTAIGDGLTRLCWRVCALDDHIMLCLRIWPRHDATTTAGHACINPPTDDSERTYTRTHACFEASGESGESG